MSRPAPIVAVHAARRGTGKSTILANMAVVAAAAGLRVGVVDTDLRAAGMHLLFGLEATDMPYTLNDYLAGVCSIGDATFDLSSRLGVAPAGAMYLTPASTSPSAIARITRDGLPHDHLDLGLRQLPRELSLNLLLIDAPANLSEDSLRVLASCDRLIIVLRPDHQNYMSTAVLAGIARELEPERLVLVINEASEHIDADAILAEIEPRLGKDIGVVIPHSNQLLALGSRSIFALQYPHHPLTRLYRQLVARSIPEVTVI
jgi:septum site-determining protein MinD